MPDRTSAIIVAGGASARMGFDKVWAEMCGRPLVAWPLLAFAGCDAVDQLVLVARAGAIERARALVSDLALSAQVVVGGPTRSDSVRAGLAATDGDWVVVHDAARPLVTADLIEAGLAAARETGAAIAAMRETNTVKSVRDGCVVETLERTMLWAAQTPQVFRRQLLVEAHQRRGPAATDDATLVEALGVRVRVYEGAYANIKVTTPIDLQFATLLLSARGEPLNRPRPQQVRG